MSRVCGVGAGLEACGTAIQYAQSAVDNGGNGRVEEVQCVDGDFGEEDERAEHAEDEVVVVQSDRLVSQGRRKLYNRFTVFRDKEKHTENSTL